VKKNRSEESRRTLEEWKQEQELRNNNKKEKDINEKE
jgi:hypothetical protein